MKAKYINTFTNFGLKRIFAFEKAELAKFNQTELDSYENSLKNYRDLKGVIDTAFGEGKAEVAKLMKTDNEPIEKIIKYTGLTKDEIDRL